MLDVWTRTGRNICPGCVWRKPYAFRPERFRRLAQNIHDADNIPGNRWMKCIVSRLVCYPNRMVFLFVSIWGPLLVLSSWGLMITSTDKRSQTKLNGRNLALKCCRNIHSLTQPNQGFLHWPASKLRDNKCVFTCARFFSGFIQENFDFSRIDSIGPRSNANRSRDEGGTVLLYQQTLTANPTN